MCLKEEGEEGKGRKRIPETDGPIAAGRHDKMVYGGRKEGDLRPKT